MNPLGAAASTTGMGMHSGGAQLTAEARLTDQWGEYLRKYEDGAIQEAFADYPDTRSLLLEYRAIERSDPDLAQALLERPHVAMGAGQSVLDAYDTPIEPRPHLSLRIQGLPEDLRILPRQLRAEHLGRLVPVEGLVSAMSRVKGIPIQAAYECKFCGNIVHVPQEDDLLQEPIQCDGCEKTGPWRFRDKESDWIDMQLLRIQERPDQLRGGATPETRDVYCRRDLVQVVQDGDHVIINAIPMVKRHRIGAATSSEFETVLEAISIERAREEYADTELTPELEARFNAIAAKPDVLDVLASSYEPAIVGHQDAKRAAIFSLVGASDTTSDGQERERGHIHVLLCGDPGTAKTRLVEAMEKYAPRCVLVVGSDASGAGLAASSEQDKRIGAWILRAGAAVLADGGICGIDELGHIDSEQLGHLHTIMESGVVRYTKHVKATLRAETTIFAAMNPKLGERFDPYLEVGEQIGLQPALLSRFDLVFAIKDMVDSDHDLVIANAILDRRNGAVRATGPLTPDEVRRYVAYARRLTPHLTAEAKKILGEYFRDVRRATSDRPALTYRVPAGLARLTQAHARIRLSLEADARDARAALDIFQASLKSRGAIDSAGRLDPDVLVTGSGSSQHDRVRLILQLIKDQTRSHEAGMHRGYALEDDLIEAAQEHGLGREQVVDTLRTLQRNSQIYARGGTGTWAVLSG